MFKKTGQKFVYETLVPKIKKNLTRRRSEFDKVVKGTDDALQGLSKESKVNVKSKGGIKKTVSKISKIIDDAEKKGLDMTEKKAKGGRVGLKRGTNLQKIKKTFGPNKNSPQSRMTGKKKKFPDLTGDGKVTFADILKGRGVINGKNKKKVNLKKKVLKK